MFSKTPCPLCVKSNYTIRHKGVRDATDINVLKCNECGLFFLSDFLHADDNYYSESKMWENKSFDQWKQQTALDDARRFNQYKELIKEKKILDFGCGNGGFLDLCKHVALCAIGLEKDAAAADYIKSSINLEIASHVSELPNDFDYAFLFHVMEHLENPTEVLDNIIEKIRLNGEIIIETPNADDALLSIYNCSAFADFTYWSAHVILYNERTLCKMVEKAGLKVNWIKQYQRYPLANHLLWIQKGIPGGGVDEYSIFNDKELNSVYEAVISRQKACDTLICSIGRG
jgi:2-polyprenyl-3-methyl-5-hydroxy-6-metoxy-1,4-benzoquinol methylase